MGRGVWVLGHGEGIRSPGEGGGVLVPGLGAMLTVWLPAREGDPGAADDESVRSWEAGFDADGARGRGDGVLC